jgi:hypothetical protein
MVQIVLKKLYKKLPGNIAKIDEFFWASVNSWGALFGPTMSKLPALVIKHSRNHEK